MTQKFKEKKKFSKIQRQKWRLNSRKYGGKIIKKKEYTVIRQGKTPGFLKTYRMQIIAVGDQTAWTNLKKFGIVQ